jgi:amino acid transporter
MIWAIVLNGITGFIMTVTFAYCIGPLEDAIHPPYFFAFIGTFYNATGSKAGATVMTSIITLLTLCSAISNVATASRQMFAFARDRGLPVADFLSYVRPGWDIPLNSILVSMCITALLSLINLGSTVAFNAIVSIGVVSLLSSCKYQKLSIMHIANYPRTSTNHEVRCREHQLHPVQAFP